MNTVELKSISVEEAMQREDLKAIVERIHDEKNLRKEIENVQMMIRQSNFRSGKYHASPVPFTCDDISEEYFIPFNEFGANAFITDGMLEALGESGIPEMEARAWENSRNDEIVLKPIMQILEEMLFPGSKRMVDKDIMYVLTNGDGHYGARVIMFPECYKLMRSMFKDKKIVWAIPSSVHEWIIVPNLEHTKENYNKLLNMLREVNESQVEEKDWLSNDNIFEFHLETEFFSAVNPNNLE